jgi:hypothetical protein
MTTNLHDKMLAAIDAYFSASDGTEAEVAENLLLDVRDEINKQKYVPETNFGNMAEPKIGCVNHDCDQCKAVQEPVKARHTGWGYLDGQVVATYAVPVNAQIAPDLYTTPPAPQPVPVQEPSFKEWTQDYVRDNIHKLKATPPAAQPALVQEPVAWLFKDDWGRTKIAFSKETANEWGTEVQPLYTTPPAAQPAVPLTEDEMWDLLGRHPKLPEYTRAVEARYGITATAPEKGQP